ncbi:MAG: hypothetical protein ACRDG7_03485 [Candidatus Limnocylindria bacterium]
MTARLLALVWPDLRAPEAVAAPFEPMLDALDDLSPRVEAVDAGGGARRRHRARADVGPGTAGRGTGRWCWSGRRAAPHPLQDRR